METIKSVVPSNTIKIELPKDRLTLKGIKQLYYVCKKKEGDPRGFNPKLRAIVDIIEQFDTN
jgi:hypothetical protein